MQDLFLVENILTFFGNHDLGTNSTNKAIWQRMNWRTFSWKTTSQCSRIENKGKVFSRGVCRSLCDETEKCNAVNFDTDKRYCHLMDCSPYVLLTCPDAGGVTSNWISFYKSPGIYILLHIRQKWPRKKCKQILTPFSGTAIKTTDQY